MSDTLPQGWAATTLGELVSASRARVHPDDAPELPYVGLEHVEAHTMKLLGHGDAGERRSSSVKFSKGDVLYGKMRPYLNKVWVAEFHGICSAEFLVFPKAEGLNSQLLAYRLNSPDFVDFANQQVSGDRPRVDFGKLSRFPVLLPPSAEQDRIVAKLDALLHRVAIGEAAARRAIERVVRYRTSVLRAAVTGELTSNWRNANRSEETGTQVLERLLTERRVRWEQGTLRRLIAAGRTPKESNWERRYRVPQPPDRDGLAELPATWGLASVDQLAWTAGYGTSVKCTPDAKGPAVLRIPNIRNGDFDLADLKYATKGEDIAVDQFVAPGDLLLVRTNGSLDLIGRAAVAKSELELRCSFASYLIRLRLVGHVTLWSWISLAWESDGIRSQIQSRAATTAGQYNISLSGLADLAIPLPPKQEQAAVVKEVERRLSAAERLASTLALQLARAQTTRRSVISDALLGKLTTQEAGDEPAHVLLAHRRAALEVQAKTPKAKRMPHRDNDLPRRTLLEVLRSQNKPMSPEQLFRESGYQREFETNDCDQEIVDNFYAELRGIIQPVGPVTEKRPDANTVLLEAEQ